MLEYVHRCGQPVDILYGEGCSKRMSLDLIEVVQQPSLFDYASLDGDTCAFVQELDAALDMVLNRAFEDIGLILQRAKDRLSHGQYEAWIASKGIPKTTAWRYRQIAQGKDRKSSILEHLDEDTIDQPVEPTEEVEEPRNLRVTNDEKQNALESFFTATPQEVVEELSNGEIADKTGVTEGTVRNYKKKAKAQRKAEQEPAPDPGGDEIEEKQDNHVMRVMGSSESPEWYTPQEIVRLSIKLLGKIDLDPCSNSLETPHVPADKYYTKEMDGLSLPWEGTVYLNPPYGSEIPLWVEKLVKSYEYGVTEAIALLPGRIDTNWFQPLYKHPQMLMCNVRGRLQYENSPYNAPFPNVIVYLGERRKEFIEHFRALGPIMQRVG